jgi:sulfatase maturation enzyme AslB (radical SAM superfamily)
MLVDAFSAAGKTLPIFRLDGHSCHLYYAPGYLVTVDSAQSAAFAADLETGGSGNLLALELTRRAEAAVQKRAAQFQQVYSPVCLTLYLNNTCALACEYCYSAPAAPGGHNQNLAPENIRAAAEIVAQQCADCDSLMTVVFHGGGEPMLSQPAVQAALEIVDQVAAHYSLQTFKYIATNGVMPVSKAAWMAEHFDLVGLSCDGPAEIQARQRPLRDGRSSLEFVERTVQVLRERHKPFRVRTTLTPRSYLRQVEIAEYLCATLRPGEIEVEPVYWGGRASQMAGFVPEQAEAFVDQFFKARQAASRYGIPWVFSGSRPGEIHGPYCNVFRDVLNLIPGGQATACFKCVEAGQLQQLGLSIGQREAASGAFVFDDERIQTLRQKLSVEPEPCQVCINHFHCVRGCPDQCPLATAPPADFRCRLLRLMLGRQLWEAAAQMRGHGLAGAPII